MDVEECAGPLESVLSAQLPGHADGTDRRVVAGSGAPLKPPPGGASGGRDGLAGRRRQSWVLRSTLTLKTTGTTLVSVDGDIGHRGALVHLPHASPETITEAGCTPSATVTPTQYCKTQ